MNANVIELPPSGKNPPALSSAKKVLLFALTSVLLATIPFYVFSSSYSSPSSSSSSSSPLQFLKMERKRAVADPNSERSMRKKCDIFSGNWVPYPEFTPYYTNRTQCQIDDRQNCMKFGRPDTEFLKWRWKPDDCELSLFDAAVFFELVRGKSMAFVGDSIARNQIQSLICLLASVATPVDVSHVQDTKFTRWFYAEYKFTVAAFWSTHLVKARESDPNGYSLMSLMNLYLDEVDDSWAAQISTFDYVIISAGQWFSRPFMYYEKGEVVGCHICQNDSVKSLTRYYGYRKAFRTAFQTLLGLEKFKGTTFLRTFSPPHFENGEWDKGGNCLRTAPFKKREMKADDYVTEFYLIQAEELRAAERRGRRRKKMKIGPKFRLLDTTEVMLMRPDGHPNKYGHGPNVNASLADCVHWCLPGPVDVWNQFLLEMMTREFSHF